MPVSHSYVEEFSKFPLVNDICRASRLGKAQKLLFVGHFRYLKAVGDILQTAMIMQLVKSFTDKFRYASTLLDDHSRYYVNCVHDITKIFVIRNRPIVTNFQRNSRSVDIQNALWR